FSKSVSSLDKEIHSFRQKGNTVNYQVRYSFHQVITNRVLLAHFGSYKKLLKNKIISRQFVYNPNAKENVLLAFKKYKKQIRDEINSIRKGMRQLEYNTKTMSFHGKSKQYDLTRLEYVYDQPGTFTDIIISTKCQSLYDYKKPITKENHFGIELEFFCKADQNKLAVDLYKAGMGPYVTLKDDGSIQPPAGM